MSAHLFRHYQRRTCHPPRRRRRNRTKHRKPASHCRETQARLRPGSTHRWLSDGSAFAHSPKAQILACNNNDARPFIWHISPDLRQAFAAGGRLVNVIVIASATKVDRRCRKAVQELHHVKTFIDMERGRNHRRRESAAGGGGGG